MAPSKKIPIPGNYEIGLHLNGQIEVGLVLRITNENDTGRHIVRAHAIHPVAADIELTASELKEIGDALDMPTLQGNRLSDTLLAMTGR